MWVPRFVSSRSDPPRLTDEDRLDLGPSIHLSGTLTGSDDVAIDGKVDGTIRIPDHCVTLGPHARVSAPIVARRVSIAGSVTGDVTATESVEVASTGSVRGNIMAPAVAIADGATFTGSIDMRGGNASHDVGSADRIALAG